MNKCEHKKRKTTCKLCKGGSIVNMIDTNQLANSVMVLKFDNTKSINYIVKPAVEVHCVNLVGVKRAVIQNMKVIVFLVL
jgi:hypothetical protein